MLEMPDALAILGFLGAVIVAIIKAPALMNGRKGNTFVIKEVCAMQHKAVDKDLKEIKGDVKDLLKHFKISGDNNA